MADENQVVEQPQTESVQTPPPPREISVEDGAKSLERLFSDDGALRDEPAEQETEQKPSDRDEQGRFKAKEGEQIEEDDAPTDWDDDQKAAYKALPPENRAILKAADAARRAAIEAERAQHAETLKAAQEYPARLKELESSYKALPQISEARAELVATIKRDFADIKSPEDRVALTDPRSEKYDVTRSQRFEALLQMGRELTQAEAMAEHNRQEALKAEQQKDVKAQEAKVYELIPEWGKLAKEGKIADVRAQLAEVRAHLKSVGIPAEEADAIYNAHHLQIARESMLYRKAQAEEAQRKRAGAEKLAAAPRVQKPGAGRQQTAADEQLAALANRARGSGRLEDVAAVMERIAL